MKAFSLAFCILTSFVAALSGPLIEEVLEKLSDDTSQLEESLEKRSDGLKLYAVWFHGLRKGDAPRARARYEEWWTRTYNRPPNESVLNKKFEGKKFLENVINTDPFLFAGHFAVAHATSDQTLCKPFGWGPDIAVRSRNPACFLKASDVDDNDVSVAMAAKRAKQEFQMKMDKIVQKVQGREDEVCGDEALQQAKEGTEWKGVLTDDEKHFIDACRTGAQVLAKEVPCAGGTALPGLDRATSKCLLPEVGAEPCEGWMQYGFPPKDPTAKDQLGFGETKFNCVTMPTDFGALQDEAGAGTAATRKVEKRW